MTSVFDLQVDGIRKKSQLMGGRFRDRPVQSVCYDSRNRRYIVGFSDNNNPETATLLRMKDLSFTDGSIQAIKEGLPLKHVNDLEYDPDRHRIFAARGDSAICVIHPDTLEVEKLIPIGADAWAISRYRNGDFFVFSSGTARRYNGSFGSCSVISTGWDRKILEAVRPAYGGYWQGSVMADDVPYMIWTEKAEKADRFLSCELASFTPAGDTVSRCACPAEVEGALVNGGVMEFVFGNIYIGSAVWDMASMSKTVNHLFKGVKIAKGATEIDFSQYVPEGCQLFGADVSVRYKGSYYHLPYLGDGYEMIAYLQRVAENKVTIRSVKALGSCWVRVTGFLIIL